MRQHQAVPAKIVRPTPRGIHPRERLFERLDRARARPVVWVSGPAGCGKTTLVTSYVESRGPPCVWCQIDAGDQDLASFFHYLGLADQVAAPRRKKRLPHLTPEYLLGIPAFSRNFFEELFDRLGALGKGALLVLDNVHEVGEAAPLHTAVLEGVSRLPAGSSVFLAGRGDPPPAYARLRTHGELERIGWDELRLTPEESEAIVALRGLAPGPEDLRLLHDKAHGWAAGLQLFLEAARTDDNALSFIEGAVPEEVFEYLRGAVFDRLDAEARDFLLKTSLLSDVTVPTARELTGHPQAARLLSSLHRHGDFTEKRVHSEAVYQYHPLFREFLLERARETLSGEDLSRVKRTAAALLARANRPEDAARLLSETGDWEGLAGLILQNAPPLLQQGRNQTLEGWLRAFPDPILRGEPWLLYWLGAARLPYSPPGAQGCFEQAFAGFREQDTTGPGLLLAWAGVVSAIWFAFTDFHAADPWLALLPELVGDPRDLPPGDVSAQVASAAFGILAAHAPDHPDLVAWEEAALTLEPTAQDSVVRVNILAHGIARNYWSGRRAVAEALVERLRALVASAPLPPLAEMYALHAESVYGLVYGEVDRAAAACRRALDIGAAKGVHIVPFEVFVLFNLAHAELADSRLGEAWKCLERMTPLLPLAPPWAQSTYFYMRGRLRCLEGRLESALAEVEESLRLSGPVGSVYSDGPTLLLLAEILDGLGRRQEAFRSLSGALRLARRGKIGLVEINAFLVAAHLHWAAGHLERSRAALRRAMRMGREMGVRRPYGFYGAPWAALCARALEAEIETDYVRSLIRHNRMEPPPELRHLEAWPWPVRVYTLGGFEVVLDGEPLRTGGKGQRKPLALLKALIAFGGRDVSEARLADALWPDADGAAAHQSLTITLHRLRKLLGVKDALVVREGRLSLHLRRCWVDAWALERLLGEGKSGERAGSKKSVSPAEDRVDTALGLYKGPFLPEEVDEPWAIHLRERLRNRYLRGVEVLGARLEETGRWADAAEAYRRALEVDPLSEDLCRRLMACHEKLGQPSAALAAFERCRRLLRGTLGVDPSAQTRSLADRIRGGG